MILEAESMSVVPEEDIGILKYAFEILRFYTKNVFMCVFVFGGKRKAELCKTLS